jgi:arylsulfatase A-like enzyme
MTRRSFLAGSLAAGALRGQKNRPNVLMLSLDDLNDWVGCLGYAGVKTPNIDRLASRSVLFTDAHCPSPLCSPSRTAIFTGLGPATTGIYNNDTYWRPNLPNVVTMPEYFRKNGYHVAGAGKVYHHVAGFNPPDQWDEFQLQQFDDPWWRRTEWYPWVKKIPNPPGHPYNGLKDFQGEFDWGVLPKEEREYGDMAAVEWSGKFFARSHSKPFFACVGLWHPHIPMFSPQKYYEMYKEVRMPEVWKDDLDDIPAEGQRLAAVRRNEHERIMKEGKWREAVHSYLAAISFADAMIGRIVDALDRSPHAKNTIVVLWSDNGWHLGEKEHWHKSTLWQRATHVPLMVRTPGGPTGIRKQPVTLLDLYPTLVELTGLPAKRDLEGLSLAPVLSDGKADRRPAVITYLPGNHAVCTSKWRYIRYRDGGEELYDRAGDPHEFTNLAGKPEHAALKQDLARWMPKTSAPPKPDRDAYDFDWPAYTYRLKK